jgi:hypothetical protein
MATINMNLMYVFHKYDTVDSSKGRASQLEILPEEISHISATESERAYPIPVGAE